MVMITEILVIKIFSGLNLVFQNQYKRIGWDGFIADLRILLKVLSDINELGYKANYYIG